MEKRSLVYIGNKLSKKGLTATTIDTLTPLLEAEGLTVFTASSVKNKVFRLLDMIVTTLLKASRNSVVLIDTYSTQNFFYAVAVAWVCRRINVPYIPILHGGNLPERLQKNPKLSKSLFGKAKTNVSPSKFLIEAFKKYGFNDITFIPNSICIDDYPFLLRKELTPNLLWVRSFAEIYNPMLAVKLVKKLREIGIDVTLSMVGPDKDGSLERCMTEAKKHGLPITFTGKLTKRDWITLSKMHSIFINTTNFDNMPVSVIEASALGMPIVSTNVGGISYLIEDKENGLLVPPNDVDAFCDAVEILLSNSSLSTSLSRKARMNAEAFDWQQVKAKWLTLIS